MCIDFNFHHGAKTTLLLFLHNKNNSKGSARTVAMIAIAIGMDNKVDMNAEAKDPKQIPAVEETLE